MVARHDRLVEDLAGRLEPVRRLPRPGLRTVVWLGAVAGIGALLASRFAMIGLDGRTGQPDLFLAALGAVVTAVTAAYAAFATSVPGRSSAWALLPLPALALWLGASGPGCLRSWVTPLAEMPHGHESVGCLGFLVCVSAPLSLLLLAMLRRACPLRPNLTAALAGLAVAAAAAALLMPFHPDESTFSDLLIHLGVIAGVIAVNGLAGGRLLSRRPG